MEKTKTFLGECLNIEIERERELCEILQKINRQAGAIEDFINRVNNLVLDFDDDNERYYLFFVAGIITEMISNKENIYNAQN